MPSGGYEFFGSALTRAPNGLKNIKTNRPYLSLTGGSEVVLNDSPPIGEIVGPCYCTDPSQRLSCQIDEPAYYTDRQSRCKWSSTYFHQHIVTRARKETRPGGLVSLHTTLSCCGDLLEIPFRQMCTHPAQCGRYLLRRNPTFGNTFSQCRFQ